MARGGRPLAERERLNDDALTVRLSMDDARTVRAAGSEYARTLSEACSEGLALALTEQERLIQSAITNAGYTVRQSKLVAREFTAAATAERDWLADASSATWGTA